MRIGILALQGAFDAHARACEKLGHRTTEIRKVSDLEGIEGLILPGGESSTQLRLLDEAGLAAPLATRIESGIPVLATCAGAILLAREVRSPTQWSFGLLDCTITRNAYGRQLDSLETVSDDGRVPLVFIRAPRIDSVGSRVEVLATYQGSPVLVRQGAITAATFHPELSADLSPLGGVWTSEHPDRNLMGRRGGKEGDEL